MSSNGGSDAVRQRDRAPDDQMTPTSTGCVVALVVAGVIALGAIGYVVLTAISIGNYMANDPALQDKDFDFGGTTVPSPVPSPYGTTQKSVDGNDVTVHGLQTPVEPAPGVTLAPPEGGVLVAVDAEVCAAATPMTDVNPSNFTIPNADRTSSPMKEPAFPYTKDLPRGSCVRGWISFEIHEAAAGHPIISYGRPSAFGGQRPLLSWTS